MTLVTGFHFTDAMTFVDCPACGQPAGRCCMNMGRNARRLVVPHSERLGHYDSVFPDRAYLYEGAAFDSARLARVHEYNGKLVAR